ncbi:hypothetical protein ADEAN_000517500 [Angomonas deanei]|uniref:Uncharacterized protein n=1 Tax=Angomonas deanei TaxID=59799 RepID=A0A7G2CE91_9TRYP|nr:hypothetical protein ADEAN_000517500 [Angomonas deanei]
MKQDVQDALKEMELYHFRTSTSKEEKEVCQFREPFFNYNNTVRIEEIKIREDTLVTIDGMCEVVVYDTRILQPTTTGRPRRNDVDRFYHDFLGLPLIVPLFSVGVTPHPSSQRFTYDYPTFDKMFLRSFYCALNRHLGIIPNLNLYPASTSNPGALRERLLLGDGYVIVRPTGGLTKCIVLDFDVDFISRKEDGTLVRRHTPDSIRRFRCCPGGSTQGRPLPLAPSCGAPSTTPRATPSRQRRRRSHGRWRTPIMSFTCSFTPITSGWVDDSSTGRPICIVCSPTS